VGFLIKFFLRNWIQNRRIIWMILMSIVPPGCACILLLAKPLLTKQGVIIADLFPQISFFLYLHFLIPLIAVFIGTAIIADEVEERTLPYLLVRPVPRRDVILAKTITGVLTIGLILCISTGLTYSLMFWYQGFGRWISNIATLLQSIGVLILGLLVYVPLFAFFGGSLKHPVLGGLLFSFGWENMIGFLPGNIKFLTVIHYLHVLFPHLQSSGSGNIRRNLFNLVLPTKQISAVTSIIVLLIMSAVFIGLTVSLLYLKEYRLEQD
jgi:ABC-2 type transport system permease protein